MNVAKKQNARTEKASIFTSPRMRRLVWLRLYRNRYIYLMILPVIVYFILLKYVPMWFLRSAFYDYKLRLGFEGSKYVGLKYFERLFTNPNLLNYIGNTLKLNIAALVILFPMPVIFAIMLNEMRNVKFMKFVQTISYLPHFVSTVVLVSMITTIVSPSIGSLARLTKLMGGTPINYLSIPEYFVPINVISGLWQGVGWGAVIYVSTLAGIDRVLYEAAKIDGANRWQTLWRVTIPNVMPSITICMFLSLTNGFKLFDQNLALTAGRPFQQLGNGETIKTTEMLALNIVNAFGTNGGGNRGAGQAKAVIFFIVVAAISIIQLQASRRKEVQQ